MYQFLRDFQYLVLNYFLFFDIFCGKYIAHFCNDANLENNLKRNQNVFFLYIKLSIIILLAAVLFQLVTLPVEIDASKRALVQLEELNLVYNDENKSAKKVLSAAAMTYIASLLSSILDLLRLILILNSRNDDRR